MMSAHSSYEQAIVLDLEMNPVSGEQGSKLDREIIEIGAVRICDNKIIDTFQSYVKPVFSNNVSPFIRRMTGINEGKLRHAPSFTSALCTLSEWIGNTETKIYAWSDSDYRQFQSECIAKEMDPPVNMTNWADLQLIYYEKLGADIVKKKTGLKKAAEQNGIVMDKQNSHRALYDADVTAQIFLMLSTGRFQKQAALLKRAVQDDKEMSSQMLLGEICKCFFEQTDFATIPE